MSMFTAEYQDFKRKDPTVLVKVTLYDDQKNVIKPAISKAKLVQGTKYAGDYEITQDGDQYCLSTKQIAKLPSGSYGMELWGDDGSIYPSAGFIPIRIHRNADDSLEKTKPTIDLDSIIEDLHKAGLNVVFDKIEMLDSNQPASITSSVRDGKNHITLKIPRGIKGDTGATGPQGPKGDKGDKGDTGTVDNAGLTTAPAFVSLNSKINDITSNGGGRNLVAGTAGPYTMGYGIPNTTWQNGYAYLKLPSNTINREILPQDPHTFYYTLTKGTTYTQTIWFETDAKLINSNGIQINWFTNAGHDGQSATLIKLGENKYKLYSTYTWPGKSDDSVRLFDIFSLNHAFDLSAGTYLKFGKLMLEEGIISHDWTPAPEDAPSSDSQLVHKTGNETLAGDKVFVGNTTLATTTILAGNYGLRVTTSGIEKTTDGKTWVPANI